MSKLCVETVPVSPIQQNARILWIEGGSEAVVVDPGADAEKLFAAMERLGVVPKAIWLTHSHFDHAGGVAPFVARFSIPVFAHPADKLMRGNVEKIVTAYGLPAGTFFNCPEPTDEIVGGETLALGDLGFQVFFTPGHCPGHVAFYQPENGILLSGDCLFKGSIGRTDLPGCSHQALLKSIREVLFALPDDTKVLSGHGSDTEIGVEKQTNPYV